MATIGDVAAAAGVSRSTASYALSGKTEEAMKIVDNLERASLEHYVAPDLIAVIYLMMGEREKAFQLFSKAIDELCSAQIIGLKIDPIFDPFRTDERFVELLRRTGQM